MQQVGRFTLAGTAAPLSGAFALTSQLFLPVKSGRHRARIIASRAWVLHRVIIIRIVVALGVALVLGTAFQARGGIIGTGEAIGDLLAGRFAKSGFGIEEIAITGQIMARESDIAAALGIDETTNSFNFDLEAARRRIIDLPAIADASLRKIYPSRLIVEVSEVTPVARWRIDGVTFVIDAAGNQIADASPLDEALPLVIGDGAADDAQAMIKALELYPDLKRDLVALSRIGDRRWDLIYQTGLRIRLPEKGVDEALVQLQNAQAGDRLLDRDLVLIDMRVAGQMALRLARRDDG